MVDSNREPLRFLSPDELRESVPPQPPWVIDGYLARGVVSIIAGKPKVGKSTLVFAATDAIASGVDEFLGRKVNGGPVVYVSEEGASTLAHKLPRGNVRVLSRDNAWPKPSWPDLIAGSIDEAQRVSAVLLVVDTFAFWAGLGAEQEKDAGATQAAMDLLVQAANAGLAVLLVAHSRKGGGEDGEGIRGSNAIPGTVDIVLELERPSKTAGSQRVLLALSRYPTTPGALMVERADQSRYVVLGEGDRADGREMGDRARLLTVLEPGTALTRKELEAALSAPEAQWHNVMGALIEAGDVVKNGAGKKGDPYRFQMVRRNDAQEPTHHLRTNGDGGAALSAALPAREQQNATPSCADAPLELDWLEQLEGAEEL